MEVRESQQMGKFAMTPDSVLAEKYPYLRFGKQGIVEEQSRFNQAISQTEKSNAGI
jgi:hypothetical protein